MLMGLLDVSKEGEVSLKGEPRVLYSTMMGIRMLLINAVGLYCTLNAT
jgi:hypothetical protein